jgi:hypothetical protein
MTLPGYCGAGWFAAEVPGTDAANNSTTANFSTLLPAASNGMRPEAPGNFPSFAK